MCGHLYQIIMIFQKDKYFLIHLSSTTIESIAKKKSLSEEASRVHHKYDGNGRYPYFGNRGMDSDIV